MMPDPATKLSGFIAELRRRRVFRAASFAAPLSPTP